ncbi:cytidylyltransferase domain-containing protein [Pseudomonadota bacterium]
MVLAIVQARMSSNRLPGKMMKTINSRPLIEYVIHAISDVGGIDDLVVATTSERSDDVLVDHLLRKGVKVHRGSENDVLERFYDASIKFRPELVVRITGDCPLLDPDLCGELIDWFRINKLDYACLSPEFAEGLDCEVFSFELLEEAYINAKKASEREHVTLWIHNNKHRFKIGKMPNQEDDSGFRITVDEALDFDVVQKIVHGLGRRDGAPLRFPEVKKWLKKNTRVWKMNSQIVRNEGLKISLAEELGCDETK